MQPITSSASHSTVSAPEVSQESSEQDVRNKRHAHPESSDSDAERTHKKQNKSRSYHRPPIAQQLESQLPSTALDITAVVSHVEASASSSVKHAQVTTQQDNSDNCKAVKPIFYNSTVDRETDEAVSAFLRDLDDDSYKKRFGNLSRKYVIEDFIASTRERHDAFFLAYEGGKVIGIAECTNPEIYEAKDVISVNMVVDGKSQGKGVGKNLLEVRDRYIQEQGYRYKVGSVYPDNVDQINRLLRSGWTETTRSANASDADKLYGNHTRDFWLAVNPEDKDIEPQPSQKMKDE